MTAERLPGVPSPAVPRNGAVDVLKALAIVGTVTIHASTAAYYDGFGSLSWLSAIFWGTISRWAVPVFFLCSGALLLDPDRDLSLRKLWGRNILHILLAMWVWAFAYKVYGLLPGGITLAGLWQGAKEVLLFHHEFHLYYLHITLLVYALLPMTRLLARAERRTVAYLLILWLGLGILWPTFQGYWPLTLLTGIPRQWPLNLTYTCVGFTVLGWYLRAYAKNWKPWAALFALGFLWSYGGTVYLTLRDGALNVDPLMGNHLGVALMAAGLGGWVFARMGDRPAPRFCTTLSQASFCIFLAHVFFLYGLRSLGLSALLFHPIVSIPLTAGAILACSFAVWLVLRRIPVLRRWII